MNCRRVRRLLPLYVGGDVPGRRADLVEMHLRLCVACREELSVYEASRQSLFSLKGARSASAPDLWPELRARIGGARPERRVLRRLTVAAGGIALLLVAGAAVLLGPRSSPAPAPPAAGIARGAGAPEIAPSGPGEGEFPLAEVRAPAAAGAARFDAFPTVRPVNSERSSWDEF